MEYPHKYNKSGTKPYFKASVVTNTHFLNYHEGYCKDDIIKIWVKMERREV